MHRRFGLLDFRRLCPLGLLPCVETFSTGLKAWRLHEPAPDAGLDGQGPLCCILCRQPQAVSGSGMG